MTLGDVVKALSLEVRAGEAEKDRIVQGGYVSDLLSDVIAGAKEGDLWVTLQIHQNVVAVAFLNNLAGIVIVGGREPDPDTLKKGEEQGVPIMVTQMTAYETAGKLYAMGIRRQV
ncbi:MAG: serine kinase [Desulfomonile tiedjei]|nr:serine kinase [Desulfomonile tiedjei]